jgi:hypothetical protein
MQKLMRTTALPHEAEAALLEAGKENYVLPGSPLSYPSFGSGIATVPLEPVINFVRSPAK